MDHEYPSRRAFLKITGAAAAGSWIVLGPASLLAAGEQAAKALAQGDSFSVLSEDEAADFSAMAARIVPTDDTPGATEAGVIYFIDRIFEGESAEFLSSMRQSLAELREAALASYGAGSFSSLPAEHQDALLMEIQDSAFFWTIRYLTIAGMFSHPKHGGNRNHVGWQLLGFDHRQAWQPPFGFYDADYAKRGS